MKHESLGKYLTQIFSFIKGQYLAQIKIQIVKQIGCIDAALQTRAPGAEDAEPVILIPVGLPCLERGRLLQKKKHESLGKYLTQILSFLTL